ncbi:sensor histidine kinase [Prescottella sp. R16]|uniref:sensor histidine kinase n=1 Tax=Prescottella sp. R16 TaxID=3064529 RepID=UPI00351D2D18
MALLVPWSVAAVLLGVVVALAFLARTRGVLRDEMVRAEERARIARDMHDTLAAGLSRISLFASALQVNAGESAEKVANSAAQIRAAAHEALDELKSIVGVLRGTVGGRDRVGHQGIDAVPELTQSARAAGLHCTLTTDLAPGDVGTLAGHVCFRVVQEALTNAQKYAHDQVVAVVVRGAPECGIRVDVRNALSAEPSRFDVGSRTGLQGLTEQAREVGGTLEAGPVGDGFVVSCWVPWSG